MEFVFGLPGSPELLYNDLYDHPGIRAVLVRHETSAVFMAMAYARVSGRVGVVHASPGPGMANLVPGLLEALRLQPARQPRLGRRAQDEGMGAFQETPSLDLARPVSKWAVRLDLAHRTAWTLERAFSLAQNGKPGPVYVEIPGDVAGEDAEIPPYRPAAPRPAAGGRPGARGAGGGAAGRLGAARDRRPAAGSACPGPSGRSSSSPSASTRRS